MLGTFATFWDTYYWFWCLFLIVTRLVQPKEYDSCFCPHASFGRSVKQAPELKTRNAQQHAAKDSLLCCQNMFSPDVGDDAKQKMGSL